MIVIGIDCATQQKNIGLAYGSVTTSGKAVIKDIKLGSRNVPATETIEKWLQKEQLVLLALDAPLGWPTALGQKLSTHYAGMPLEAKPEHLFSRQTDRKVESVIGKRPLEVGANLIARTAHSALGLLESLREKTGLLIPLAWEIGEVRQTCAIEVYPAATLAALGIKATNYKDKDADDKRLELIGKLGEYLEIANQQRVLLKDSADAIDAVICVLAAHDFLLGKCFPPDV